MKFEVNFRLIFTILTLTILFSVAQAGASPVQGKVRLKLQPEVISDTLAGDLSTASISAASEGKVGVKMQRFAQQAQRFWSGSPPVRIYQDAGIYEAKHREYGLHLWYEFDIGENDPIEAAVGLASLSEFVQAAEPIYSPIQIYSEPEEPSGKVGVPEASAVSGFNDTYASSQWAFKNTGQFNGKAGVDIRFLDAVALGLVKPSSNVIVAVLDDGVDFEHPDLKQNIWLNNKENSGATGKDDDLNGFIDDVYGYNFVDNSGTIYPGDHGTHVAGVIAAVNDNGEGVGSIAGGTKAAPGVKIMSCQIFRGARSAPAAAALVYAADNGAVIAQNSWGYGTAGYYSEVDKDAVRYFIKEAGLDYEGKPRPNTPMVGGIVIFAAGNRNSNDVWYPSADSLVVAVAAIECAGKKAYYSNYASWVDITAPGGARTNNQKAILSTVAYPDESMGNVKYAYKEGTSMACPHVSGVAALIVSSFGSPTLTPDEVRMRLEASTRSLENLEPDYVADMGYGLLDVVGALTPTIVPLAGISIPEEKIQINVGAKRTPRLIFTPDNAFDKRVVWESSNTSVFKVDRLGRIEGVANGSALLTVKSADGKFVATRSIEVLGDDAMRIQLDQASVLLPVGGELQLKASLTPTDSSEAFFFESSNSEIAAVSSTGVVLAVKPGVADITVRTEEGISADCRVNVYQPVDGIEVIPTSLRMMSTDVEHLTALVKPSDALNREVRWSSSDPRIVTVDSINGTLIAKSIGSHDKSQIVTVTATTKDGNFKASAIVIVYEEPLVPQGFSPNGDGVNDLFKITYSDSDKYSLRIFNHAGELCYESLDYNNSWDGVANVGKRKGKKISQGTYFYVLSNLSINRTTRGYTVVRY